MTRRFRVAWLRAVAAAPRDDGFVAGFEALAFGVLIFVGGTLLIVNAWGVVDAKLAVTAAAREATRAFVESPAGVTVEQAHDRAVVAATQAMNAHGHADFEDPEVLMEGAMPGGGLIRCATVRSTVRTHVPSLFIPFVGVVGDGFEVSASYEEWVDPYRSGLAAGGTCDVG